VSWRWQVPVYSPVSPRSLVGGFAAACGLRSDDRGAVTRALIERYDAIDAVLTDSGTSALILALRALVPVGGTVAYPGYGCVDLTSAAIGAGMQVRLYDLDPTTLSPDLDSVRSVIERGVDAIVVAHLYGYPADIEAVRSLASAHGIPIIEDAAQGSGGALRGRKLGSFGDVSVLSFGRGKGMTAGGGGAVLVRTRALTGWAQATRAELGMAARGGREIVALAGQMLLSHPLLYRLPASVPALKLGEMVYKPPKDPRAMSRTAAAILPSAIQMEAGEIAKRRARADDIISRGDAMSQLRVVRPVAGGQSGFLRLAFLDPHGVVLARTTLGAVQGYPLTLDQHMPLRPLLASNERAGKGSCLLRDRLFTVPTHSRVANGDARRLLKWMAARTETAAPGYST
jgi:hypothetical protein